MLISNTAAKNSFLMGSKFRGQTYEKRVVAPLPFIDKFEHQLHL
jgi:hypothetical protein